MTERKISLTNREVLDKWQEMKKTLTEIDTPIEERNKISTKLINSLKEEGDKMIITSMALAYTEELVKAFEVLATAKNREPEDGLKYIG